MLTLPSFLTPLESAVIAAMVEHDEFGELFSTQLTQSRLESRKYNGYGFFTTFSIPDGAPLAPITGKIFNANAMVGGELCGFLLWIRNGRVDFLEGYPLGGDAWPRDERFEQLKLDK